MAGMTGKASTRAPLLLLLIAIPLFVVILYNELAARAVRQAELRDEAKRWLANIEDEQRHVFGEAGQMLNWLVDTGVAALDPARCPNVMAHLGAHLPRHLVLTIADADGIVRCSTAPQSLGRSIADRAAFQQARETGGIVRGLSAPSVYSGRPMVPMVRRYEDNAGRFAGTVNALIDTAWLEDLLAQKPLPPHAGLLVADQAGTVFARAPESGAPPRPLPGFLWPLLEAPDAGVVEIRGDDGRRLITAFSPLGIGVKDTLTVLSIDLDARMAAADGTMLRTLLTSAAALLATVLTAAWGLRRHLRFRERAEEELKRAKERAEEAVVVQRRQLHELETIYDTAPIGLTLLDRDLRFVRINEALAEINGVPVAEHIGRNAWDVVPSLREAAEPLFRQVLETGEPIHGIELHGTTASHPGIERDWIEDFYPLKGPDGTVVAVGAIVREVTEERQAKRALEAAKQEAEVASRSKSKFLAAASHDLRQPMQSLFLFAAALERHLDASGREKLVQLERSLEALKGLLDSLLDVSKLEAGLVTITLQDIPVNAVLDELRAAYQPVAESRGLAWHMPDCFETVRSDRVLLGRLLRNLIENAVRYTEGGGVTVRCLPEQDRVRVEVEDTGIGIPPEELSRIFEEFHQVANVERNRQQGLGLGLAIVQRIANLLGYTVEVRSRVGRGSTFSFSIPRGAATPAVAPESAGGAGTARVGPERLAVVVDDEVMVLMGLQAMLRDWGCTVIVASGADQAVDRLRAAGRCPDFILADYRLGRGELGTEAVARIREFCGQEVLGVLLTGETGTESLREAAAHGLRILHKPVTARHLADALDIRLEAPAPQHG
ncbi:ATP-binding protein [Azospirillum sp. BE72]|uniref:ATP-binding protein n=1 Tax=Azospirillum sp. BE72 TaxID=2817776 RepID=UPI002864988A|nr:ATP-binding protein [Azospirillum sp. BE72]MDR6775148.1 PAS domain S-box-containing protein [Azospirillum sp. BE72]